MRAEVARVEGLELADVEVEHLGLEAPLPCGGDAALTVVLPPGPLIERVDLTVVATNAAGECARRRLRTRLRIWEAVPVAARPTPAGDPIELATGRVPRAAIDGVPVDPTAGPYVARGPLPPGAPVTLDRVRVPPDERSGGIVTLVAQRGSVSLEASGRLLRDARVGDPVEVLNSATGVVVRGVLVEPGRVQAGATP